MDHQPPQVPEARPSLLQRWGPALAGGLAGALTVTVLNEGVRRVLPHAPRMDVIGERALSATLQGAGVQPPQGAALYRSTMLADLVSNAVYYSLVGLGPTTRRWPLGGALGLAAGVGAVTLPRPLGLGRQPGSTALLTPLLTATWYLAGGLVAAATMRALEGHPDTQLTGQ